MSWHRLESVTLRGRRFCPRRRLSVLRFLWFVRLEVQIDAEQCHQMLRAAGFELEEVSLVVTNVA